MRPNGWTATVGIFTTLTTCLTAELVFEKTRIDILAKPDQEQVEAIFKFKNEGTTATRIVSVTSGCQCLSAKSSADKIAPGESGEITGLFKVASFPGMSEKSIHLSVLENGTKRNIALTVAVELKELILIKPRTITWSSDEVPKEQTFTVTMLADEPIHLKEVEPSRSGFEIRIDPIKEGRE